MKHRGIVVGRQFATWLLVAGCLGWSLGWGQPAAKSREELLKRASGLADIGQPTATPAQKAPPVSPETHKKASVPETKEAKRAAEGRQAVVRRAWLDAVVMAGDHATTRPVEPPVKKPLPGKVIRLSTPIHGEIYLPAGWKASGDTLPLLVHINGTPWIVEQNVEKAGLNAVVVVLNPGGRGSHYAGMFSNPEVFEYILDVALQQLRKEGLASSNAQWGPICLSSFSAGYGAVREILNTAEYFNKVSGLALADSLHADFADDSTSHTSGSRAVDREQMRPFAEFARLAAEGKKTFVLSRSSILPPTYSGTPETAAYLIREVGGKEVLVRPPRADDSGMTLIMKYDQGNFHARGYAGIGPADHMDHLYTISTLLEQLPLPKKS